MPSVIPLITLTVQDPQWMTMHSESYYDQVITKVANAVLERVSQDRESMPFSGQTIEISVLLASNDEVQSLNKKFRGKDKPTNILSFESGLQTNMIPDAPQQLGDMVLAFGIVHQEAQEQGKLFDQHLTHLFIHGLLHLCGYDHETEDEAHNMESLEIEIMDSVFNYPNPYAEN